LRTLEVISHVSVGMAFGVVQGLAPPRPLFLKVLNVSASFWGTFLGELFQVGGSIFDKCLEHVCGILASLWGHVGTLGPPGGPPWVVGGRGTVFGSHFGDFGCFLGGFGGPWGDLWGALGGMLVAFVHSSGGSGVHLGTICFACWCISCRTVKKGPQRQLFLIILGSLILGNRGLALGILSSA
jgi:hypothetical protein